MKIRDAILLFLLCILIPQFLYATSDGNDTIMARSCMNEANNGNAEAMYKLGTYYYIGKGVKQDYKKAAEYLLRAAENGSSDAECFLAFLYYRGEGVEKNYAEAIRLASKAAKMGDTEAQCLLGDCYSRGGFNCSADTITAIKWYEKAVDSIGDDNAGCRLHELGVRAWPYATTPFIKNKKYYSPE